MTQTHEYMGTRMDDEREPGAAEIEAWQRESAFLPADEAMVCAGPPPAMRSRVC